MKPRLIVFLLLCAVGGFATLHSDPTPPAPLAPAQRALAFETYRNGLSGVDQAMLQHFVHPYWHACKEDAIQIWTELANRPDFDAVTVYRQCWLNATEQFCFDRGGFTNQLQLPMPDVCRWVKEH